MSREGSKIQQEASPRAREDNLSITQVGDETIVYNQLTHKASCLNLVTATVWTACNGTNTIKGLLNTLRESGFQDASEDIVRLALHELAMAGLLQELPQTPVCKTFNKNRRDILSAIGKSAAITIPVISTISIQPAIAGISQLPNGSFCTGNSQCLSNNCVVNVCQP